MDDYAIDSQRNSGERERERERESDKEEDRHTPPAA
jgi:hypothetical protein